MSEDLTKHLYPRSGKIVRFTPLSVRVEIWTSDLFSDYDPETGCRIPHNGYITSFTEYPGAPIVRASMAHLVLMHRLGGGVPPGYHVGHTCGNFRCVEPTHLFLAAGKSGGLTRDELADIRERILAGEDQVNIARDYGVTRQAIHFICSGESYGGVTT